MSFEVSHADLPIPDRLQPTVFRLVQESLNNVAKHAEAKRVGVEINQTAKGSKLILSVHDDGPGFDPASTSGSGLGLRQMVSSQ